MRALPAAAETGKHREKSFENQEWFPAEIAICFWLV
jgi:hypothetical protein